LNNESVWNRTWVGIVLLILGGAAAIGIVFGAVALLIAAFRMAWNNPTPWVVLVVQVLIAVITIIFAIGCVILVIWTMSYLRNEHKESVEEAKKRAPTFAAAIVLVADGAQILASNSFRGGVVSTTTLCLLLLLWFWIANELVVRGRRWAGTVVWYLAPLTYLFFALSNQHWRIESLVDALSGLNLPTQMLGGAWLLFSCCPTFSQEENRQRHES
jgi:hypothetical protein